jgi:preprotein translocase subunit SecE
MFQITAIGGQIVFWFLIILLAIIWALDFWIKNESSFLIYVF